jgi:hypothetical protein
VVGKKKKAVKGKVGYDKSFMTRLLKEGNLQAKPHCDLEKMRAKERKTNMSKQF